jgi:DNA-binding response OmpR family regulator
VTTSDAPATSVRPADLLLVDDEPMVREVLTHYLEQAGYRVTAVADGAAALAAIAGRDFDLVVLDLMLPSVDGLSVLRELRHAGSTPVVVVSARGDEDDRIRGLQLGADDYVAKPFSPREVVARVGSVLRRAGAVATFGTLRFGDVEVEPAVREVRRAGTVVELTRREFDLLVHLARSPRQVFSRGQLLAAVWDSSPEWQDPATVTVHIGHLRHKLEDDPGRPRHLITVRGVGYRFDP